MAKVVDVFSICNGEAAACRLDFDQITLHDGDPESLDESKVNFPPEFLSPSGSGTMIVLRNIQKDISRSLNYIINRLTRTFEVNEEDFKIFVRRNDEDFHELSRKELDFFNYMDTIVTFGDEFSQKIQLVKSNSISQKYKYLKRYDDLCAEKNFRLCPIRFQF